jgi:hypothetical protein
MQIIISPLRGAGNIEFGMPQEKVRELVGGKFRSFKRGSQDSIPCDYFMNICTFFYYDSERRLEAVEFASPARPTIAGMELLGLGFDEACANLEFLDSQLEREVDGAIAYRLGVSIYSPLAKNNPTAPVESVVAFRPGYYN